MKGRRLNRAMIFLVSCFLPILAMEVLLRWYDNDPLKELREGRGLIVRPSAQPGLRYELTPGSSGWVRGAQVSINTQGFRGPEVRPGPHAGYRIVILGDSIAFGISLPLEATFGYQLQQLLRSDAQRFEVLNSGVMGYDTLQEVRLLEVKSAEYAPDLVVVTFCMNDAGVASITQKHVDQMQALTSSAVFGSRLVQFVMGRINSLRYRNWHRHMNEPEVFRQRYKGQIDAISSDEVELLALMRSVPDAHPSRWYREPYRIGRLRFAFRRLKELASANGFSVVIVVIPWLVGDSDTYPHRVAHRIVDMESRRAGFDIVDLTDEFMEAGVENLRFGSGDLVHPNKEGHTIIANALSDYARTHVE